MLTFCAAVRSPQQGYYSPQSKYSFQISANPISLAAKPPLYRDLSSPGYVSVSQPKAMAFHCDNSDTAAPPATSVTWPSCLGPGGEIPPTVSSVVGITIGSLSKSLRLVLVRLL